MGVCSGMDWHPVKDVVKPHVLTWTMNYLTGILINLMIMRQAGKTRLLSVGEAFVLRSTTSRTYVTALAHQCPAYKFPISVEIQSPPLIGAGLPTTRLI